MRHNDWKNPFDEEIAAIKRACRAKGLDPTWLGEAGVGHDAYEAGADAMLEGLKKGAQYKSSEGESVDVNCRILNGYLVFIEE